MTEAEWLAATDPMPMLEFLRETGSKRKLQLFVCLACRRVWPLLEEQCQIAIEISERYSDGFVGDDDLWSAASAGWGIARSLRMSSTVYRANSAACWTTAPQNRYFAENAMSYLLNYKRGIIKYFLGKFGVTVVCLEQFLHVGLLRDIFGNPFRPVTVQPSWLTSTVVALAEGIYSERAFDRLPILADALQDAGCDNEDILSHCRSEGPHVKGCWAVDLLLGKQ